MTIDGFKEAGWKHVRKSKVLSFINWKDSILSLVVLIVAMSYVYFDDKAKEIEVLFSLWKDKTVVHVYLSTVQDYIYSWKAVMTLNKNFHVLIKGQIVVLQNITYEKIRQNVVFVDDFMIKGLFHVGHFAVNSNACKPHILL